MRKAGKEERRRGETSEKGEANREETAKKERKETRNGRKREEDGSGLINCSSLNVCYASFQRLQLMVIRTHKPREDLVT